MTALTYQIVQAKSPDHLQDKVAALLPTMQPLGGVVADQDNRVYLQAMTGDGGAVVTDEMALTGVVPSGSYTDTVTFTVVAGQITGIALS